MMPSSRSSRANRSRRHVLNLDLNIDPPFDNHDQVATSVCSNTHFGVAAPGAGVPPTAPIDVEAIDDDVIVSSPRAFAEAKNKSQRNNGRARVGVVDLATPKRRRTTITQSYLHDTVYINLEAGVYAAETDAAVESIPEPQAPAPPKEVTFTCPVCIGPLVEEMSTKCGHIFCKECIKGAIAAQKKCPTCRKKTTSKDIIRVYLPATNCS